MKLWGEIIKGNYEEKLSQGIMRRNYHSKLSTSMYISTREKCGNYRDTGVSKIEVKAQKRKPSRPPPF